MRASRIRKLDGDDGKTQRQTINSENHPRQQSLILKTVLLVGLYRFIVAVMNLDITKMIITKVESILK